MLKEETRKSILELQKLYPEKRSALIPALHLAQAELGYLPREIQNEVAALFDIDPNEVNSVVTFYDMFYEKPRGKHLIHLCKNVSCMLRGSDCLLEKICEKLNIEPGETTADGQFTLLTSECLAACDRAPILLIDDQVIGPVKENELENILLEAKKREAHPSPCGNVEAEHA